MQPCMVDLNGRPVEKWLSHMQTKAFLRASIARGERTADCWRELRRRNRRKIDASRLFDYINAGEPDRLKGPGQLPQSSVILDHVTMRDSEFTLVALDASWGEWTHQIQRHIKELSGQRLLIAYTNFVGEFDAKTVFRQLGAQVK